MAGPTDVSRLAIPPHRVDFFPCFFPCCRPQIAHCRGQVFVPGIGLHGPQIDPTTKQSRDVGPPEFVQLKLLAFSPGLARVTMTTVEFATPRQPLDGQQHLRVRLIVPRGQYQVPSLACFFQVFNSSIRSSGMGMSLCSQSLTVNLY